MTEQMKQLAREITAIQQEIKTHELIQTMKREQLMGLIGSDKDLNKEVVDYIKEIS